ncbi:MAG: hypothetical protein VB877_09185 [Pirellulaceae bacterium]
MILSMTSRATLRLTLSACLVVFCTTSLLAQGNKQPPKEYLRSSGTILKIAPGFFQVKTKDGGQWVIQVPSNREGISVIGTAETNWLQRGMYVRFTGLFDKRGKPSGSINQLQVFTPDKETRSGVFPDSGLGLETKELFSNTDAAAPQPGKQPARSQFSPFMVAGRVASMKGGKLSVLAGRTVVQTQLAEKATISVNVSDARLARVGDLVELEAWYPANQKAAARAIATKIKVTASKPYAMPKRERPTRKPTAAKPKADPEVEKDSEKEAAKEAAEKN